MDIINICVYNLLVRVRLNYAASCIIPNLSDREIGVRVTFIFIFQEHENS